MYAQELVSAELLEEASCESWAEDHYSQLPDSSDMDFAHHPALERVVAPRHTARAGFHDHDHTPGAVALATLEVLRVVEE